MVNIVFVDSGWNACLNDKPQLTKLKNLFQTVPQVWKSKVLLISGLGSRQIKLDRSNAPNEWLFVRQNGGGYIGLEQKGEGGKETMNKLFKHD